MDLNVSLITLCPLVTFSDILNSMSFRWSSHAVKQIWGCRPLRRQGIWHVWVTCIFSLQLITHKRSLLIVGTPTHTPMCHIPQLGNEASSSTCDNFGLRVGKTWRIQVIRRQNRCWGDQEYFKWVTGFLRWYSFQEVTSEEKRRHVMVITQEFMSHGTQRQGSRAQGPGRSNGEGQSANWFVYWAPILFHEVPWKEPVPEPGKVTQHPVLQKGVLWHLLSLPRLKHGDRPEPAERSQERAEAESTRWEWTRGKKHTTSLLLKYSKESQRTGRWEGGTWNNTGRYKRENGDPERRRQQRQALFFQGHLWRWGRQAGAGRLGPFACHSTQSSIFHKMFPSRGFLWVKLSIYKSINKANITNLVLN